MTERLQQAFDAVLRLPLAQQEEIASALLEITQNDEGIVSYTAQELREKYQLTPESEQELDKRFPDDHS